MLAEMGTASILRTVAERDLFSLSRWTADECGFVAIFEATFLDLTGWTPI